MSPLDLAAPAVTTDGPIPFSKRLAERLARQHADGVAAKAPRERRAYPRRTAQELEWLRGVRLKQGPGILLVDLSEGGALLEASSPLRPGARFTLALEGIDGQADVALHVLRCHIAQLKGEEAIYRGACEFFAPLDFARLVQPKAVAPGPGFVGVDAALSLLLQRCLSVRPEAGRAPTAVLESGEVVRVLESVHGRVLRDGVDAYGRGVAGLLADVLPAMKRGARAASIVEFVESRLRAAVAEDRDGSLKRLVQTGTLLMELVRRLEDRDGTPTVAAPVPRTEPAAAAAESDTSRVAWQRIVVRYREGTMLKGFTQDFHPSRGHFSLWPTIAATRTERTIVPLARLKAIFFVRDFAGNASYVEDKDATPAAGGRRIEVTFLDNEVLRGTTLGYSSSGPGFFVNPSDQNGNNMRVFVINAAVRHVRFP